MNKGLSKRGWRSGRDGSWYVDKTGRNEETRRYNEGLATNYPWRTTTMANGAWQFFCMAEGEWYTAAVPTPDPNETPTEWAERVGLPLPMALTGA